MFIQSYQFTNAIWGMDGVSWIEGQMRKYKKWEMVCMHHDDAIQHFECMSLDSIHGCHLASANVLSVTPRLHILILRKSWPTALAIRRNSELFREARNETNVHNNANTLGQRRACTTCSREPTPRPICYGCKRKINILPRARRSHLSCKRFTAVWK